MTEDTALEMATLLEEHMRPGNAYSLSHCTAVLFGTRSSRDRAGLGHIGRRWTGYNAGEAASAVDTLVSLGLLEWVTKGSRTAYRLAA